MENPENVLMELSGFEKTPSSVIPKSLEDYLVFVAKTGNTVFPWHKIKPLIKSKLEVIIREFSESCPTENLPKMPNVDAFKFGEMKERILEQLESYTGTPFTVQRLCELLVQPKRHYKRTDKFMRGLEKVMLVVSTVDPINSTPAQETSGSLLVEREKLKVGACSQVYESPSKRIRLASAEDEGGPCDSADGSSSSGVGVCSQAIPILCPTPGPSTLPSEPSPSTANIVPIIPTTKGSAEAEMDSMDIDTECTSSEAKLLLPDREGGVESSIQNQCEGEVESSPRGGVESSQVEERREASPEVDDWVMVEKPDPVCDNGLVSTSAEGEGRVDGVSESTDGQDGCSDNGEGEVGPSDSTEGDKVVSDSTEGEGVSDSTEAAASGLSDSEAATGSSSMEQEEVKDKEEQADKTDTCSSSDQRERTSMERGEEETCREAEPAEEREELIGGEEEAANIVSVQSSEERNELDSVAMEPRGAADSSDEISGGGAAAAADAPDTALETDQPSCSEEGEQGNNVEGERKEQVGEENSPDQSDTVQ